MFARMLSKSGPERVAPRVCFGSPRAGQAVRRRLAQAVAPKGPSRQEEAMRIVGGEWKGRALRAPAGDATRPTSDRAREAMFNVLAHAAWSPGLEGRRVLDLFAGSGALGLEALSRGARFALFVETSEAARGAIRDNIEAMGAFGATRVHRRDATDLGAKPAGLGPPFDLAFLDPPYHKGLGERALAAIVAGSWLAPGALIVFEHGADETIALPAFEELDARRYGAAMARFLRASPP